MNDNIIFSLDIGTRSIVGVVAEKYEETMKVIAYKSVFHEQRTMVDGQIEDIKKVSKGIEIVKSSLEQELGMKFTKVYIAAAGRSLKTEKVIYEKILDSKKPLDENIKKILEMDALQKAHDKFYDNYDNKGSFYCVGYSVLGYKIDNNSIANIEGHRAEKVSVEIIAAFLPHIVVEGLYSCMDYNNLDVQSLTLEPIAAMNLVIPADLRLLNIALVDIGAGTSDIAVSKDGTIIGYDMATIAGDEITESIMKSHLVDFKTAEKIKMSLDDDMEKIEFTDILGMHYSLTKENIIDSISNTSLQLCQEIATKILSLNNEPPVAVFLIGGGSKTSNLRKYLSEFLNLPEYRIAIGSESTVKNVDISIIDNFGPELITPVGISYSSIINNNYDFFSVIVNGIKIRLYNIRQMKVMDALLMAGFDSRKLMGFSGKTLSFILNNKEYFYKGEYSTPAQIFVNSNVSNIETKICPGDIIEVIAAVDGVTPVVKISDIVDNSESGKIIFNNTEVTIGTKYLVNNIEVESDYIIGNSDIIEIINIKTLNDLVDLLEINPEFYVFKVSNKVIDLSTILIDNSTIEVISKSNYNDEEVSKRNQTYSQNISDIHEYSIVKDYITVSINGETKKLNFKEDKLPYIFADMLIYTNIDPTKPQGKIIILHNGNEASYTSIINDGDDIVIKWQNSNNI
ncbi:rod shape-determining protein [Sedimentibacter sp. zth1]|uniref:cell division protein FtsA n=1 Tax=Sedimentibacter sp. zth1 TaxID=2816908 RepID=UPI001A9287B7|nr:cell division FtsA domain-containing protein [Sedimentibacter sp. zth1]QSX07174.1 rod shape-determining protein [Sedimentibacter sp. zth1]